MSDIAVVFFAKGRAGENYYGLPSVRRFIDSYDKYEAGIPHELIFVSNAWEGMDDEYEQVKKIASEHNARIIELPDEGLDFGVYFRAAEILQNKYLFFLNSNCEIISDSYLKKFYDVISQEGVGLIGPVGSWCKPDITLWGLAIARVKYFLLKYCGLRYFKRYKNHLAVFEPLIKSYSIKRVINLKYLSFPNYYIATFAFAVDRQLFLDYSKTVPSPKTKSDTFELEHGHKSLTKYIMGQKYKIFVVGDNGVAYPPEEWNVSGTYACGNQENLMISDKNTKAYMNSDDKTKMAIARSLGKIGGVMICQE